MGNKITEVQYKRLRSGIELRGIARSDRGTKYIEDSIVVPFGPKGEYPSKDALESAIQKLIGTPG